ncbi:hypothetical protein [Litorivicinus lipolyticus]|uniref:hypothetical protein n=1 Tax=Litorivicinus lipolyticus TaxID=418701 RepID=UPI003B592818
MGSRFNCVCDGGFGNRINSLVSGLILWENSFADKEFVVIWPSNRYCEAKIFDLLDLRFLTEAFPALEVESDYSNVSDNLLVLSHDKNKRAGEFYDLMAFSSAEDLKALRRPNLDVFFCTALVPFIINYPEFNKLLPYIVPSQKVYDVYWSRYSDLKCNAVAVHMRGTDYGFSMRYFLRWKLIMKSLFFVRFHVFTDDSDLTRFFNNLDNAKVVSSSDLPSKYEEEAPWYDRKEGEYNILRGESTVISSFAELLYLSEHFKIITSRSTFLFSAFLFSSRSPKLGLWILFQLNRSISLLRVIRKRRKK